jgi:Zn-dependent protease with chaperone function
VTDGVHQLALLGSAAFILVAAMTALATAVAVRIAGRSVRVLAPRHRETVLLAVAAAPAIAGVLSVKLALLPSLGALLGVGTDHCADHDHHVHLCLQHAAAFVPGLVDYLATAALAVLLIVAVVRSVKAGRLAAELLRLPAERLDRGLYRITARRAFAATVGWRRARVLVSSALCDALEPAQLDVVVAHERAHVARRDSVRMALAHALTLLQLPATRRAILAELALAIEECCDEAAARKCGDRVLVAETLLAAARAGSRTQVIGPAPAFDGAPIAERVEAMLRGPHDTAPLAPLAPVLVGAGVALIVAIPHVHHWTETLLHALPR